MSQFIPSLKPCNINLCHQPRKLHIVVFFLSLYSISLGTGGYKPCLQSFGADQYDDDNTQERKKKMSFFNWWNFSLCFALLLGSTLVVYVQDDFGWGTASLVITIFMTLTVMTFYVGKSFYRYRRPEGNPLTPVFQVLIAAIRKRKLSHPSSPSMLYQVSKSESHGRLLSHTSRLRFLDKAAIIEDKNVEENENPWRLATVTRVEETKLLLNVIPIWVTSLIVGICVAQATTLFVKQAAAMNLKISNNSFNVPPASITSFAAIGTLIVVPIYDKIIVPILRKVTGNERGISILQRMGIGLTFIVIVMVVAALVESKRLRMDATEKKTMSVVWLIPQYLLIGFGDSFSLVALQEYFYDQVPDSMRSLGMALYLSVIGVGNFLSSFLITIVDHVTGKNGKAWIGKDINSSHLDRFYWLLAVISALNLCVYVFLAKRYTYKTVQRRTLENDDVDINIIMP